MFMNDQISLHEILVKTAFTTQITLPTDKQFDNPIAFGSGFIIEYENEIFFVTADHTLHLDDYDDNSDRTGKEYIISIFNNYTPSENFLSSVITPLGGFYFMEQFNLEKPDEASELVDITLCMLKKINLQYPFLCDDVDFAKQSKLKFYRECFSEPKNEKNYFVFGQIRTKIDGIRVGREKTLKEQLKFISNVGDYFLFNTLEIITDKTDWEGLSGSPVISEDGECVGVLSSVNENSNSIWIVPISKVKMLLDIAIQQEKSDILK